MSKILEPLWAITLTSASMVTVRAQVCEEQNGALVFRSGDSLSIKVIIACGQWLMVERDNLELGSNPADYFMGKNE